MDFAAPELGIRKAWRAINISCLRHEGRGGYDRSLLQPAFLSHHQRRFQGQRKLSGVTLFIDNAG